MINKKKQRINFGNIQSTDIDDLIRNQHSNLN